MWRISNENGESAGWRNWGRLMLSLIPAAFGGAAVLWIIAGFGWIDLTRELRMERRTMQSVGISVLPKSSIGLLAHDGPCLKVDSSYMDGDRLQFYASNSCSHWLYNPAFYYRIKAHNGTVIDSHEWLFNGDSDLAPKERREQFIDLADDSRAEQVELWMRK